MPRSPSKLPPLGTESMCDPNRIGGEWRIAARAAAEDVAGRIDARLEPAPRIRSMTYCAARDVGVGVRDPADAVGERAAGGRPNTLNPRYFSTRDSPTVPITSGEHYGAVINLDFDFAEYHGRWRPTA